MLWLCPTAQMSDPETAATASNCVDSVCEDAAVCVGTMLQDEPSQCSASVYVRPYPLWSAVSIRPTAHASLAPGAVTAASSLPFGGCGVGTCVQPPHDEIA